MPRPRPPLGHTAGPGLDPGRRRRPRRAAVAAAGVVAALAVGPFGAGAVASAQTEPARAATTTTVVAPATPYGGVLPSGATWTGAVPQEWNGTILLFSHGYGPLVAQDAPAVARDALLERGYALVGSSYSGPSWWALESAVDDQFAALAALQQEVGPGDRVVAVGQSMGGLVSSLENERSAGRLDGVLTTCGIVAGGVNLDDYQLDGGHALTALLDPVAPVKLVGYADQAEAALAAEQLTALAREASTTPAGRARLALAAALYNAPTWVASNPEPAPRDYDEQLRQQVSLLDGTAFPYLLFITTGRQQIEVSAGGNPSSTRGVDYRRRLEGTDYLPLVRHAYRQAGLRLHRDLARLTRTADIVGDPAARERLTRSSQPTGRLSVPQLDLHTVADELVPSQQLSWYDDTVARAGRGAWHRQVLTRTSGHCAFTADELLTALDVLEVRLDRGHWPRTDARALTARARAAGLAQTAFTDQRPARLGGARDPARGPR